MNNKISHILLRSMKQHWGIMLGCLLSIIASLILDVLPPLLLAQCIDQLTAHTSVSLSLAVSYFACLALSALAGAVKEACITSAGEVMTRSLRSAMMDKTNRLPASYFTRHQPGSIASIEVADANALEEMFSSGLVSMMSDAGTIIAILVVLFTKSVGLGVLVAIILPLLTLFTRYVQKKMRSAHLDYRKAEARLNGMIPETLHIHRSLRVYNAENFARKRYRKAVDQSYEAMEKTNFFDAVYSPVILLTSAIAIALMMALSGQNGAMARWFNISVGTAAAAIDYINRVFKPLSSIGMEIQTIQSSLAGYKRIQDFLNEPEDPVVTPLDIQPEELPVSVQHVCFAYEPEQPVLQDVSLTARPDESVHLEGRTGAGKSTLFKLLLGLYTPQKGTVRLFGIDPRAIREQERRKIITCVQQSPVLIPGTIRDQISLYDPAYTDRQIDEALELVGLKSIVYSFPQGLDQPYTDNLFSQGQKQLLMIARAIVSHPSILLLDECAANLDPATEAAITQALQKASTGRTVLSITHRANDAPEGNSVLIPSLTQANK